MFSFFFSSRRRHTRCLSDWSSDVCSSDLKLMTGVTWGRGGLPRMDYEVTLEGKKLAGNDFFCTTTFPVGDSFCSLVVGGWGGRVVGISSINGADASENETHRDMEFKQGQWYRVRIRVTAKRIEAWVGAERVVDL